MPSSSDEKTVRLRVKFYMENRNVHTYETDYLTGEQCGAFASKLEEVVRNKMVYHFKDGIKENKISHVSFTRLVKTDTVTAVEIDIMDDDGELRRRRIVNG